MSISVTNTNGNSVSVTVNGQSTALVTTQQSSVTVTASSQNSVTVTNKGPKGDTGATGPQGPAGAGVAAGGIENQVLQKNSTTDYDTKWSAYRFPGADGSANQFLKTDGSGTVSFSSVTQATGNELENVVEDTTPQLGGDLDVNGNKIVSASGGDIRIEPTTTGDVIVRPVTGSISLQCQSGVEIDGKSFPASIKLLEADTQSPRHSIHFFAPSTWDSNLVFTLPSDTGSDGQVLKTNGSGVLSFVDQTTDTNTNVGNTDQTLTGDRVIDVSGNVLYIKNGAISKLSYSPSSEQFTFSDDVFVGGRLIAQSANGTLPAQIELRERAIGGNNAIILKAPTTNLASDVTFVLPDADGSAGQVMKTDGSGNLSFVNQTAATSRGGVYSYSGYSTSVTESSTFYYQFPTSTATSSSNTMISSFVGQGISHGTYGANGAITLNGLSSTDTVTYSVTVKITTSTTVGISIVCPSGGQFTSSVAVAFASASEQTFVLTPASAVNCHGQGGNQWVMGVQLTFFSSGSIDVCVSNLSITVA